MAAALLPLTPLPATVFFVTAFTLVMFGLRWHGWLGGARRLTTVSWLSDGSWQLSSGNWKNIPATLSADTRVGDGWLWLRWHICDARPHHRSMLLLKGDALPAEIRRLSVRLRLESVAATHRAGA